MEFIFNMLEQLFSSEESIAEGIDSVNENIAQHEVDSESDLSSFEEGSLFDLFQFH